MHSRRRCSLALVEARRPWLQGSLQEASAPAASEAKRERNGKEREVRSETDARSVAVSSRAASQHRWGLSKMRICLLRWLWGKCKTVRYRASVCEASVPSSWRLANNATFSPAEAPTTCNGGDVR